jgi:hypothetical protein
LLSIVKLENFPGNQLSIKIWTRAVEAAATFASFCPAKFYSSNYPLILLIKVIILMIQKTKASTGIATSRGSMSAIQYKPYTLEITPEIRFEKYYVIFLTV